jgi:ribosomal-protein-serine acetyltransferase
MFIHKIDENLSLKLIELRDGERVFELTNNSRGYLREWLPWLDTAITKSLSDHGFSGLNR